MHFPRSQIERTGVQQQERAFARGDGGELREADVVADGQPDLAVRRDIHDRDLVAGTQHLGLAEGDLAGDVDVEEVELPVRGEQLALRGEEKACIVEFFGCGDVFGYRAAEEVCFGF